MEELRSLLTWNASARDPFFLSLVLCALSILAVLFVLRPRLYLPLLMFSAPLPKLFTISNYTIDSASLAAAPGFSLVDMVLAAGIVALVFRRRRRLVAPEARAFGRAMLFWSASVALSVFVGLLVWSEVYRGIYAVYAFRYILTLASFGVATQYAARECDERSLRKLLYGLAVAGNVIVLMGLFYYFKFGSAAGGTRGVNLFMDDSATAALSRTYFWFFDSGNDVGFFATLIGVLNVILLSDKRIIGLRMLTALGLLACVTTCLLVGERADVLVLAVAFGYFILETSKLRHRSVRVSILFQIGCVIAVVLAFGATMTVIEPEFINRKFQSSLGVYGEQGMSLAVMENAGVPEAIARTVVSLPIGDFSGRLALNVAGVWYLFSHLEGVGFWGELEIAGFYSHHEVIKVGIEQGIPGLAALLYLLWKLRCLLWSARDSPGPYGQLSVLLRSISVALFAAMVLANTVLLGLKFMLVYWTLVGVWSVVPRAPRVFNQTTPLSASAAGKEIVGV